MNRKIRTQVPVLESNLEPSSTLHYKIADNDKISKIKAEHQYDKHHGAITPLSTLSPGNQVHLKDDKTNKWTTQGTIVASDPRNRTYLVNTPSGVLRRNRKHLLSNENKVPGEPNESIQEQSQMHDEGPERVANPAEPVSRTREAPHIPNASCPPTSPARMNTRARRWLHCP
ncbi:hypothetical protein ElyMa_001839500 [Elysia marginata]|uniref:Hypervirulence associated protein TUDOR domain-containing protein n=1 Tax=Elysia marginata TaxID=1093978 RepID=A0AAV4EKJ1_9GAST|nr:hypothetical protein ElyMa_001839500 [Elysia marginata]